MGMHNQVCRLSSLVVMFALMTGCGGGGGASFGGFVDDSNGAGGNSGNSGSCTYVLSKDITSPTRLVNTQARCDYQLEGRVEIRSTLIIEPGVVVQAEADASIVVDGGQIDAQGSPQNRIILEGFSHVAGYWEGINIQEGRPSVFDYVDVKDAGQICAIIFCPDAAFIVDETAFSFTNSTVSNSYVHGMMITSDVKLTAFSNNRFFGNGLAGLSVPGELVPELDVDTDYAGIGNENSLPYIQISSGAQRQGEVFRWKSLNAPYYIATYFNVEGGTLYLESGVELVMGEEGWIRVSDNGVIKSMGTATSPNLIRGLIKRPGYWDGIELSYSPWSDNTFQHTTISHSGNIDNISPSYAALRLNYSEVTLAGNVFKDNAQWGIYCSNADSSILHDKLGNQFGNNSSGNVGSKCSIRK